MHKILKMFCFLIFAVFAATHASIAQQTDGNQTKSFKLFFEKVYLQTDRENYCQGENIWFKAYLVNALGNTLIESSKTLYVELISQQSKIIGRETIRITNGIGNGDFKLADSIPSGNYRIRAYTNWMRNFGDNFIFEKPITILNTSNSIQAEYQNTKTVNPNKLTSLKPNINQILIKKVSPVIQFFPESGSLIENVPSLVAFKAEDAVGNEIAVAGVIVSSKGETITTFESTNKGMGSFLLTPDAGLHYTVKGTFNHETAFTAEMPAVLKKGFVMHVSDADSANFQITISTNKPTWEDLQNHELILTARHNGQRFMYNALLLNDLELNIRVPKVQFSTGISSLTVYDDQVKPQCERLVYAEKKNPVYAFFATDKSDYQPKEQVKLKLKVTDENQQPVKINFSVAAVDENFIDKSSIHIVSYLLLQSELHGEIKNPEIYFDTTNTNRFKQLDLLLLTQGWRDYVWRRLADTSIRISYLPEQGFNISGKLRKKFANKPLLNKNINLTVIGSAMSTRYHTLTDSLGKFNLDNIELYGKQSITLTATNDEGKNAGLIELSSAKQSSLPVKTIPVLNADSSTLKKQMIAEQIFSKRRSLDTLRLKEINVKGNRLLTLKDGVMTSFGYPDEILNVTTKDFDYKSLRNYILHISKQAHIDQNNPQRDDIVFYAEGKKWLPRIFVNNKEMPFSDDDPIEVANAYYDQYYNLPIEKVEKVVIKRMIKSAEMVLPDPTSISSNGITATSPGSQIVDAHPIFIIYLTLKPDALLTPNASTISTDFDGYYQARVFYAPKYDQPKQKAGLDYRTTIYWEPNVTTDANGEAKLTFFNTDLKTKVCVIAEGVTDKGLPLFLRTFYQVK